MLIEPAMMNKVVPLTQGMKQKQRRSLRMDTNRPKPNKIQPPSKETGKQRSKPARKRKITPNQKIIAKRAPIQHEQEEPKEATGITIKPKTKTEENNRRPRE